MRLLRPLLVLGAACTLVLTLSGQTVRVLSVSGEATLQAPGEGAPRVLKKGDTIVVGTKIVTGDGARVILTPLPGVNSIIAPNSEIVVERVSLSEPQGGKPGVHSAILDLRSGAVTSDLQPEPGVLLDYGVRTARGLAGARGTTYTVAIDGSGIQTVVVADGRISLTLVDGRVLALVPGQVSISQNDGSTRAVTSAAELSAGDQAIADNWVETTLDALAEAIEQGVPIDPAALDDAARAAAGLGIDVDADTRSRLERARQRLEERRASADQERVGQNEAPAESGEKTAIVTEAAPRSDAALDAYLATLTLSQRQVFLENLPADLRPFLIAANDATLNAYALVLGGDGALLRSPAAIRYVAALNAAALRAAFVASPSAVQDLLLARPTDSSLARFALTPDAAGAYPEAQATAYFAALPDASRTAFLALPSALQGKLVSANDPALNAYAFSAGRTSAEVAYAASLDATRLARYLALPPALQTLLVAQSGDAQLAAFALDPVAAAQFRSDAEIVYFAALPNASRTAFLALPSALQGKLVSANDPALNAYAFATGRTSAEVAYATSLDATRLARYLALPPALQTLLVAQSGDAQLAAFALDPVAAAQFRSDAEIVYFASLSAAGRTAYLALPSDLQGKLVSANDPALNAYAFATGRTSAEVAYATSLDATRLARYLALSPALQTLLVAQSGDAQLAAFALDPVAATQFRSDAEIVYFASLSNASRTAYLALPLSVQQGLVATADRALDAYAYSAGRTVGEIEYALGLPADRRALFLSFPPEVQGALVANPGDAILADYAYSANETGGNLHSHAQIVFFAGLSANDRATYAARTLQIQEAAALDSAFAALVLALQSETNLPVYSDATLGHYLLIAPEIRADYLDRSAEVRDLFAAYGKPGLTNAVLDQASFGEDPTDTDLRRNLAALVSLSPANQALFETFAGGSNYPNLENVPGPYEWSDAAWTRTRNSFVSLPEPTRARVLSLGAMEGLFDYSGTFIEAALADYDSSLTDATRTAIQAAGWGRYFAEYFAREDIRALLAAASGFTSDELSAIREFDLSPYVFQTRAQPTAAATTAAPLTVRDALSVLANRGSSDRSDLADLRLGETLLSLANGYIDQAAFEQKIDDVLDFARQFSGSDQRALAELGLSRHLVESGPLDTITVGEMSLTVQQRLQDLVDLRDSLASDLRDAVRDTGLFASSALADPRLNFAAVTAALQSWNTLSPATRDYLASSVEGMNLFDLFSSANPPQALDQILSALTPAEMAVLREMRAGKALMSALAEGNLPSVEEVKYAVGFVSSLGDTQRFALNELGITGEENSREGLFQAASDADDQGNGRGDGLRRLLQAYAALPGDVRAATRQIQPSGSYQNYSGRSFFFASDDGGNVTTYNVTFTSPGDLHVGAVRRLSLARDEFAPAVPTFSVPDGRDVYLRASSLIDLDGVTFSAGVRAITMEAATLNLANLDFPEGSRVALTSRTGERTYGTVAARSGAINFLQNVSYGLRPITDEPSFQSATLGNVATGSFAAPAVLPATVNQPNTQ